MKRLVLMLLLIAAGSASARASTACYTPGEAEAERGIRIHSELMVIGLNCQHLTRASDNENLYAKYRKFTAAHGGLLAGYDTALLNYYKRTGARDPEAALNALHTTIANQVALDVARMRPDLFCARYSPRIDQAASMDDATVHRWVSTTYSPQSVSRPVCGR